MPVRCAAFMRGASRPLLVDLMSSMALASGSELSVFMETDWARASAVSRAKAKKSRRLKNACFPNKQKELAWAAAAADRA